MKQINQGIKHFRQKEKLRYGSLKCSTLDSPIKFKHMIALTNETQTVLSFPRIMKFNSNLIEKPYVLQVLKNGKEFIQPSKEEATPFRFFTTDL